MNKKFFLILLIFILFINVNAQQLNPPRIIKLIVFDSFGLPLSFVSISINFKPIGITNYNGEFSFENNGGILAVSKTGYITRLIQLPLFWQGELKINLFNSEYNINEKKKINYQRKVILNNFALINKKVMVTNNFDDFQTYNIDENGILSIYFEKNSKNILIYIEDRNNSLFIYICELKEDENDSLLSLNYNTFQTYNFDLRENIFPDFILLKSSNLSINIPIYKDLKIFNPYKIYLGSNDYLFFKKYKVFFKFLISIQNFNKMIKENFESKINQIENPEVLLSFNIKLDNEEVINDDYFKLLFNKSFEIKDYNIFNRLYELINYYFTNDNYFEITIMDNDKIKLVEFGLLDSNNYLIIKGFLQNNLKIPKIFFEKKYSLIFEIYPLINYEILMSGSNIISSESYFTIIYKIK
ncbi:MAG: hypothetical protein ACK4YF_03975 [Exilispira sp.]